MSDLRSGLYPGVVTHARTRPRRHRLRYRIFMLLLDLDELSALEARLRLFGHRRPALIRLRGADHLAGSDEPLKGQVEAILREAGIAAGGRIEMLVMPRLLGGGFNPLTVFFCHGLDGALTAILHQVNNTFGERHSYLIPVEAPPEGTPIRQAVDKGFYVSPFMDMDLTYAFRIVPPGDEVAVGVEVSDRKGLLLSAAFAGRRRALTDANLVRAWLGHPWMSLGVLAAIHWEALKIWLKGERLRPRPPAPLRPVTVAPATRSG